ncbi:hypothetical protein Moror_12573 [Moniliophthora roreri MCA 2997]|nr:hypothetical protein Moror_12573 [Moniliophthora roreri MCA 2997]
MTLYKMFTSLANKRRVALKSIRLSTKFSPLLTCFYRDGAIYYTVITSIIMICTVTVVTLDGPLVLVATPFLNAGYSLAVCRLILNLRRTALGRNASATWAETVSLRANDQANDANDGGIQLEPYQPTRFRGLHVM